ncbi:MAG TPA: site-2 protease family protein [Chloroflexota bacterium]|nr:site-2 protease family protein [Chloroflexota bacterium]
MLNHSLRLGRIRGIEIDVNWSWLIIFILFTWSLAVFFFPAIYPRLPTLTNWIIGAISTLLLFVSVLLHELSHSLVAKAKGIPVRSITLFVFGGVSDIEEEPHTPMAEFLIAVAGPLTSLVIGVVSYGLFLGLRGVVATPIEAVLLALGFYNIILGVFNLLPGFPLDGGRVFRAIVWGITGSYREATQIATGVGQFFAYLLIFGGLFLAISGAFLSGLWLVFIGWFLNNAAIGSRQQAELEGYLKNVRVASVMNPHPPDVPARASLEDFVENYVLARNLRALPVVTEADDHLVGLVTLAEVRTVPRENWPITPISSVMISADRLTVAQPDESLVQAMRDLTKDDLHQLPVVQNGQLVGMLSRSDVMRYMQVRREIGQSGERNDRGNDEHRAA